MSLLTIDDDPRVDLDEDAIYSDSANYLRVADLHSVASEGFSFLRPSTWGQALDNAGKFTTVALMSGVNSFANTGRQVEAWVSGTEYQEVANEDFIRATFDDNLAQYYAENQDSADAVGFFVGSIVPGTLGIKGFRAAQGVLRGFNAGRIGGTVAETTGLQVSRSERLLNLAKDEIRKQTGQLDIMNQYTAKAIASGIAQQVMEGAAFEVAVQATMFKAPALTDLEFSDKLSHIVTAGIFNGVVGGAIESVKIRSVLKGTVADEAKARRPWDQKSTFATGTETSDELILLQAELDSTAIPLRTFDEAGNLVPESKTSIDAHEQLVQTINNRKRTLIRNLTGDDDVLGNTIADISSADSLTNTVGKFFASTEITRVGKLSKTETALRAEELKQVANGLEEAKEPTKAVAYVTLFGDDAGRVSSAAPKGTTLADVYESSAAIKAELKSRDIKFDKPFDFKTLTAERSHLEAQFRALAAREKLKNSQDFKKAIEDGKVVINYNDLTLLERAYDLNVVGFDIVKTSGKTTSTIRIDTRQDLEKLITDNKLVLRNRLIKLKVESGKTKLEYDGSRFAKILNVSEDFIDSGEARTAQDLFHYQELEKAYHKSMRNDLKVWTASRIDTPLWEIPQYAKIGQDFERFGSRTVTTAVEFDAVGMLAEQQKVLKQHANLIFSRFAGPQLADQVTDIPESVLLSATPVESKQGILSSASGNYNSVGAWMQQVGKQRNQLGLTFANRTKTVLDSHLNAMRTNRDLAIEFSTVNRQLATSEAQYVLATPEELLRLKMDKPALITVDVRKALAVTADDIDNSLAIYISPDLQRFYEAAQLRSSEYTRIKTAISGLSGGRELDPDVVRPIRLNLRDYKHYAFVKSEDVTKNFTEAIFAQSAEQLDELMSRVPPGYRKITNKNSVDWHEAHGDYEYNRSLHDNFFNSEFKSAGKMAEFFPQTDPAKVVSTIYDHFSRSDYTASVDLMRLRHKDAFDFLDNLSDRYTRLDTATFGSSVHKYESQVSNPYADLIKLGLDIKNINKSGFTSQVWKPLNQSLDAAISKVFGSVIDISERAKSPEELLEINSLLAKHGYNNAVYDAGIELWANHTAPKGVLTKFMQLGNSMLSKFTLGYDPFNALVNAVSSNVLRVTEINSVLRGISSGDSAIVGDLAKLKVPGTGDSVANAGQLLTNAFSNWFKHPELRAEYRKMGLIKDVDEVFHSLLDDFTLRGGETGLQLSAKTDAMWKKFKEYSSAADKFGTKWSMNDFAETFNRFVSADVMRQLTDVAVAKGVMSKAEAGVYINTFVNRVEGTLLASQRPLIFQGPIGQAIGLFQSYQFNLLQQLFRYVGEGTAKDRAMLLGLQGTFFGLQGLPGFQFINQHIIGTASGNDKHRDAYDVVFGAAGKEAGAWLMYGAASNLTQSGIYSRGDINPRHITILPTSISEVPLVSQVTNVYKSLKDTVNNVANGAPVWNSVLRGIEHNGVFRPLAGSAQLMQGYSTTKNGKLLTTISPDDFYSLATLARLGGSRPLEEAMMNDAAYRITAYETYDSEKRKSLATAVRTAVANNTMPEENDVAAMAASYAATGGKQTQFNQWFAERFKEANTEQADLIAAKLKDPFTYKMQLLMDGSE